MVLFGSSGYRLVAQALNPPDTLQRSELKQQAAIFSFEAAAQSSLPTIINTVFTKWIILTMRFNLTTKYLITDTQPFYPLCPPMKMNPGTSIFAASPPIACPLSDPVVFPVSAGM